MSRLAVLNPPQGQALVALLVWQASQSMFAALRAGDRNRAIAAGLWLTNARDDPRCTGALRRLIDSALERALATFGAGNPALEPIQPGTGDAA